MVWILKMDQQGSTTLTVEMRDQLQIVLEYHRCWRINSNIAARQCLLVWLLKTAKQNHTTIARCADFIALAERV